MSYEYERGILNLGDPTDITDDNAVMYHWRHQKSGVAVELIRQGSEWYAYTPGDFKLDRQRDIDLFDGEDTRLWNERYALDRVEALIDARLDEQSGANGPAQDGPA